jgi:hypothetical protein
MYNFLNVNEVFIFLIYFFQFYYSYIFTTFTLKSSIHYFLSKLSLKIMISFYLKINIFNKKSQKNQLPEERSSD